jgi:hypothetical protein
MTGTSRRQFLAAAGVGAAAGTVALTGAAAQASTRMRPDSAQEPVVALVPDPRSDEVRLMLGEREVVVRDRELAIRLLNAAGGR